MALMRIVPLTTDVMTQRKLKVSWDVVHRLTQSMSRLRAGSAEPIVNPPYSDEDGAKKALSEWDAIYHKRADDLTPTLLQIEETNRAKFGPRSLAKPWVARKDSAFSYWCDHGGRALDIDFNGGKVWMSEVGTSHLRPIEPSAAARYIVRSTSSGLPFLSKKGLVLDETVESLPSMLSRKDPAVLATRTQEMGKTRNVFNVPLADVVFEQTHFRVVHPYRQKLHWRSSLLGPEAVEVAVTKVLDYGIENDRVLLSIDFSSYDASLQPRLTDPALRALLMPFGNTSSVERIVKRFISIGLVTPSGLIVGSHGVPSGSSWTNEVDSQVQFMIAYPVLLGEQLDSKVSGWLPCDVQGDDGIYAVSDPDLLLDTFRQYGLDANEDKSHRGNDEFIYLQNYFSPHYRMSNGVVPGIYPTYRALNRIIHPERWVNLQNEEITGEEYFAIRQIAILENCKRHPLFVDFVKFVAGKDKAGLKLPNQKSLDDYIRIVGLKRGSGLGNQFGDFISGISRFETVRILREL